MISVLSKNKKNIKIFHLKIIVFTAEKNCSILHSVMFLCFRTDRSWQSVQTQIRLLLEEQSDQGLYCLLCHLHLFDEIPKVWPLCLNFR